jgi:hypothetical protein
MRRDLFARNFIITEVCFQIVVTYDMTVFQRIFNVKGRWQWREDIFHT